MSGAFSAILHLVRRWPFGAGCVLLSLVSGALAVFLWDRELPRLRASEQSTTKERIASETKSTMRKRLEQELTEVRARTREIEANLVDETNLADNLVYFYSLEERTKVRLPELHQVSSPGTDSSTHYRRVPYGLRVAGTYDQVVAFLDALETGKRLARITSFNLARTDPEGRTVALDLNVELLGKMNSRQTVLLLFALLGGTGSARAASAPAGELPVPVASAIPASVPSDYESRFKVVRDQITELFAHRNRVPAPPDPRHNPFRTPGSIVMAARPGAAGDSGARLPAGVDSALGDAAPGTNLSLLQQGAATLRVSGIVEINGRAHLVINKRPYKEGDVVQTQVQGETVYLRVKEIARRSVTLSLDDAEMTLKF